MNRCVLLLAAAALLHPGCAGRRHHVMPPRGTPQYSSYNVYKADGFAWPTVQRVVVMPFANQSEITEVSEEFREAIATELQQEGRFEVVVAPFEEHIVDSEEVFRTGQFDESEIIRLSRQYQAQGILYGLVTQYHPYAPPRIGASLMMVSPAEAVVVASVDGVWDAREQATVDTALDYYRGTQTFPLSLMGGDRVIESPNHFRRFVAHEVATSLSLVDQPVVPPGQWGRMTASPRTYPRRGGGGRLIPEGYQLEPRSRDEEIEPREPTMRPASYRRSSRAPIAPKNSRVSHLYVNTRLTRGYNFDSTTGDDGIRLVLEPRDVDGRFVAKPAPVTVVLIDPEEPGDAARVAEWNLDEAQVAAMVQKSRALGRGFHLKLLWPHGAPWRPDLHLFVAYLDHDGRWVETDQPITIDVPEDAGPPIATGPPIAAEPRMVLEPRMAPEPQGVPEPAMAEESYDFVEEPAPLPVEPRRERPAGQPRALPMESAFERLEPVGEPSRVSFERAPAPAISAAFADPTSAEAWEMPAAPQRERRGPYESEDLRIQAQRIPATAASSNSREPDVFKPPVLQASVLLRPEPERAHPREQSSRRVIGDPSETPLVPIPMRNDISGSDDPPPAMPPKQ